MSEPITFVVSGTPRSGASRGAAAATPRLGIVKKSVLLSSRRAAQDGDIRMDAVPGEDIVVVHVSGGPALYLHPEHARDLLMAQQDPARERGAKDETLAAGEVRIPVRLQWRLEETSSTRGATRGFLGDVLVQAVDTITGGAKDKLVDFVASEVVQKFDSRVKAGVYKLRPDALPALKDQQTTPLAPSSLSSLVLIHGTFSDTSGTFGKLWAEHPQLVRLLFKEYGDRVYGLDHPTLGVSPIANAITLAEALPNDAQVHLLTHSRGGLVAEVLARVAARQDDDFAAFSGEQYKEQRADLKRLAELVAQKNIRVRRVVRVACPARGTLLASKRLDAYVSVVKWALELAGVEIVPELVDFLGEVARRRADPDTLPGLAAQIPDSPLVQWLHRAETRIEGDLRVVAGDLQGDSISTWVKTLLSDAFFWTDNDLVVQTRSMYGGTPRTTDSMFVLDQGGKVSHFNYFSNAETATAIVGALTQQSPDGFRVIGPLSWGGTSATGVRAAVVQRSAAAAAALPAVFVLPGILGSNLKVGADRIWLAWRLVNGFSRLAFDPGAANKVEADGPIGLFYDDLATFLSADHDVIPFGFDWRRPIEDEASRLADAVEKALDARAQSRQPVRLLAHSMGGLVARTLWLKRPETWKRMMAVDGARLLMLGTPNGGSFAPMQVLSGDDTFGNVLTAVGAPFHGDETRRLIAQFPGLLQLQAELLNDLGAAANWKKLADADLAALRAQSIWHRLPLQLQQYEWGIPNQEVLNEAAALRRELDRQRDEDLAAFADKLLLVVGHAAFTPAGFELVKEGVVYLNAPDQGDGRVTLQSALLPGVETWTLDCEHGSLPKRREAFDAYRELLATGTTTRLARLAAAGASRGADASRPAALVRSRPARAMFAGAPPTSESEVLTSTIQPAAIAPPTPSGAALRVTVVNGDLTYIADPLLIGHYRSSKLSGAEAVMDRAIGSEMSASLERGLYPVATDSYQVFINTRQSAGNPWQLPRPAAVIVAGLGAEGELRGTTLVSTVRQAVIGWAQRLTEQTPTPAVFTLATTLLGSGGKGVSAGQAAQLIAQGVREANDRLSIERNEQERWPRVEHLRIIELYLDRATEAWRSLQALAEGAPSLFTIAPAIEEGAGALRRPPELGYRGADYDFISALVQKGSDNQDRIIYSIDSKRARSEVRAQTAQVSLITNLVSTASNDPDASAQIGRTLFNLLVPVDLDPFMGSSTATVIELDEGTAGLPWELLDSRLPGSGDDRPWAIRTKLLRKLRTVAVPGANDASPDDSVLVIGDPACNRDVYPRLFGARQEAAAVVECLTTRPALDENQSAAAVPNVISLISPQTVGSDGVEPDANAIINATMDRPWRMIHIAGHGEPPLPGKELTNPRGVVLSGDDSFLGPREIGSLRTIPELVFVNCCYLASGDANALLKAPNFDRAVFASGVAGALISAGVRCVVAAGWAVDDEAARVFATTFYGQLLKNATFIDAVAAARSASRSCGGNTWAAYQCYGDPDWRYRRGTGDAQRPTAPPPSQEYSGISSAAALVLALDTLAVKNEFAHDESPELIERLQFLDGSFGGVWQDKGEVATAFGAAWANANRLDRAVSWYERARTAPEGSASLRAIEQLANLKVRQAWKAANDDKNWDAAREKIAEGITLLDHLLAIGPTLERESLYGSAYKRLALIEERAGRPEAERSAIEGMKKHYAAAEQIARARADADPATRPSVFYPAMNRIAAQLVLEGGTRQATPLDAQELDLIRKSMSDAPAEFWSVVGQTELSMYAALFAGTLSDDLQALTDGFHGHHVMARAKKSWESVYDNATFVLSKYATRARPGEVSAARVLLGELAKLAGREVPAAAPAETAIGAVAPVDNEPAPAATSRPPRKRAAPKPLGEGGTSRATRPKSKRATRPTVRPRKGR